MSFYTQHPQREVKEPQEDYSSKDVFLLSFPLVAPNQGPSSRLLCFSLTRIKPEQMGSSDIPGSYSLGPQT